MKGALLKRIILRLFRKRVELLNNESTFLYTYLIQDPSHSIIRKEITIEIKVICRWLEIPLIILVIFAYNKNECSFRW